MTGCAPSTRVSATQIDGRGRLQTCCGEDNGCRGRGYLARTCARSGATGVFHDDRATHGLLGRESASDLSSDGRAKDDGSGAITVGTTSPRGCNTTARDGRAPFGVIIGGTSRHTVGGLRSSNSSFGASMRGA